MWAVCLGHVVATVSAIQVCMPLKPKEMRKNLIIGKYMSVKNGTLSIINEFY